MKFLVLVILCSISSFASNRYLGFRHLHNGSVHKAEEYIKPYATKTISKGRINVYKITNKNFSLSEAPKYVQQQFFNLNINDLSVASSVNKSNPNLSIQNKLNNIKINSYTNYVKSLVSVGTRSKGAEAKSYLITELQKIGLNPINTDYNIVSFIKGQTDKAVVIIGHMDTVKRTVGADDNASGASGVLELAKATVQSLNGATPNKSIYFVLSEDEEDGLLGAKQFIKDLKNLNKLKNIELAVNMDMIAYNSNGVIDLETSKSNKSLADEFAQVVTDYTDLEPNLVLSPWGSDHIPFLDEGIPALLTIENWKDHTPCWHKSCDTIETLNFEYAVKVLKVNLAMILTKIL